MRRGVLDDPVRLPSRLTDLHQGPPKRGTAGLEPASASGSAIELHPLRTAINPSANARPIRVSFVWAKHRPENHPRIGGRRDQPRDPLHDREFAGPCPPP